LVELQDTTAITTHTNDMYIRMFIDG